MLLRSCPCYPLHTTQIKAGKRQELGIFVVDSYCCLKETGLGMCIWKASNNVQEMMLTLAQFADDGSACVHFSLDLEEAGHKDHLQRKVLEETESCMVREVHLEIV